MANSIGGEALQLDITDGDAPARLAAHVRGRHGGLDVLVHNAGITKDKTLGRMEEDGWDAVLGVNLVSQERINLFADATDDHQWIHVDVERAKTGPFGGPIAHGYLTVSLLIPLWSQILVIEDLDMAVNYGLNKMRFPAPVPAGSRVRARAKLIAVDPMKGGGVRLTNEMTVEIEGQERPACIAETMSIVYGN